MRGGSQTGGPRDYPGMAAVDMRPPLLENGFREGLEHVAGQGFGPPIRDDLILGPLARTMGYEVDRGGGSIGEAAGFQKPGVAVWLASDGWQARDLEDGVHSGPRRVYGHRATSLLVALLREGRTLLPPPRATAPDADRAATR